MATRVLIVSDEPARQPAANDALVRACPDWQLAWVGSAPEALEHLRSQPSDVVICNLRQSQTVGAQLINEISRKFPSVVRAITGEASEKEMISQFVLVPHHFLSKHLEPEALRAELTRAMALDRWLGSEQMRALVARVRTFPSVPSRYFEVLKELRAEEPSAVRLGEIIASDMAMYTKILQVLNSPFYALPSQISNPTEAVTMLGFEMVKSLVLCIQVFSQFSANKLPVAAIDGVWRHSTRVAQAARKIAAFEKADRSVADDAFTAGLLHDVGKLILISDFSEKYREVHEVSRLNAEPVLLAEKQIFGVTHGEISAYLLVTWGMPLALGEAVAYHHNPSRSEDSEFSALCAVHASDVLAREIDPEGQGLTHLPMDDPYLARIGLDGRPELWRDMLDGHDVSKPQPFKKDLSSPEPDSLVGQTSGLPVPGASGSVEYPDQPRSAVRSDKPAQQKERDAIDMVKGMVRRIAFWNKK